MRDITTYQHIDLYRGFDIAINIETERCKVYDERQEYYVAFDLDGALEFIDGYYR